jgi:hypothetical protein
MPHDAGVVSIKLGYISMHGGRKKQSCEVQFLRRDFWMRKMRKPASHARKLGSVRFKPVYFFFAAFTFAHRALCAAAIFLRADADIV